MYNFGSFLFFFVNRVLRSRDSSKKRSKDDSSDSEKEKEKEEKVLTPMEILVKAARIMNPTQFELPREMRIPCIFPGTDKGIPTYYYP